MKNKRLFFALSLLVFASLACSVFTGGIKKSPTPQSEADQPNATQPASAQATQKAPADEPATDIAPEAKPTDSPAVGIEPPALEPDAVPKNYKTEFPLPAEIINFTDMGNGAINFQAKISLKDAIAFYREGFAKEGYKERELNTAITDSTFSLVFEGHASGKAIVIQGVDLGGGSVNINIRLEDL